MRNEQLIELILKKIKYKSYLLKHPFLLDGDLYYKIVYDPTEKDAPEYIWKIISKDWEISLTQLTNRELLSLKSILNN